MIREHKTISIAEQIYENLEKEILSGKYERGTILSELKLCEELGVSRTPVREALKALEREHILMETGKGLEVIGISFRDMLDMYAIRLKIEGDCAALAARNITEDELAEMEEINELQRFYIDRQSTTGTDCSDSIKDLDSRFHQLLYRASHSAPYADTLINMHKRMTKFRKASIRKTGRAEKSLSEHRDIFLALKAHDAAEAARLAELHVRHAMESIEALEEL